MDKRTRKFLKANKKEIKKFLGADKNERDKIMKGADKTLFDVLSSFDFVEV